MKIITNRNKVKFLCFARFNFNYTVVKDENPAHRLQLEGLLRFGHAPCSWIISLINQPWLTEYGKISRLFRTTY